jgi:hypothetical protein
MNMCNPSLPEPQQHQEAERDETAQDNTISALLCANPSDQAVDAWYLTCSANYSPVDARQRFSLQTEVLLYSIRLTED